MRQSKLGRGWVTASEVVPRAGMGSQEGGGAGCQVGAAPRGPLSCQHEFCRQGLCPAPHTLLCDPPQGTSVIRARKWG